MKSRGWLAWVGAGVVAIAAAAGCGDDDKKESPVTPSAEGESCARTADCAGGLVCQANVCVKPGTIVTLPDGGQVVTGAGGNPASAPPVLGGVGESCTRKADCELGLSCVLNTCKSGPSSTPGGDGGVEPGAVLGARGESCQGVRDCAEGLSCFPRSSGLGGICDLDDYALTPTGKVCGAECEVAADCCELPPSFYVTNPLDGFTQTLVHSCADLTQRVLSGDVSVCNATPAPANDSACFAYKTYCDCVTNTWDCTDNKCVYTARCDKDAADVTKGCPSKTRTGASTLSSNCDTIANTCQAASNGCTTDKSCETLTVSDDVFGSACQKDECTCISSRCYRKCDEDLDCPQRYKCDLKRKVCALGDGCASNSECATRLSNATAECRDGACVVPCTVDHDCSPSGLSLAGGAFNSTICGPDGVCQALGCASNDECASNGVKTFCTEPAAGGGAAIHSAITD